MTHLPGDMAAEYNISGEYSAKISDNEVVLSIRGIEVGLFDIKSETYSDIGVYCGYQKDFTEKENSATILSDKRFYNCGDNLNAYYTEIVVDINEKGEYALKLNG